MGRHIEGTTVPRLKLSRKFTGSPAVSHAQAGEAVRGASVCVWQSCEDGMHLVLS